MQLIVFFLLVALLPVVCLQELTPTRNVSPRFSSLNPLMKIVQYRLSTPRTRVIKCDYYYCACHKNTAKCTAHKHEYFYLPQLPANIRHFHMMKSKFDRLTRAMMRNLSNFELTTVKLTSSRIRHIDSDVFTDFPKIRVLDLSGNPIPIPELRASLQGISSPNLETLFLGNMSVESLPDNFFDMFPNRIFQKISLHENALRVFNSAIFAPFWRVNFVSMAHNIISAVNMSVRVGIKKLILTDNRFREFPDFSLQHSPRAGYYYGFYHLRSIHISHNPFHRINPEVIRRAQLQHLIKLNIGWSTTLKKLENNFIAYLPKLKILVANHMTTLSHYESYAFNSTSLRTLNLYSNLRLDRRAVDIQNMFRHCPNLEVLRIQDTNIEMDLSEIRDLLIPLKSLKILQLQDIKQGAIPEDLLWRLPKLQTLMFTGANLNSYNLGRALINVTSIQHLNVQANNIMTVNESTLPWEFRRNVKSIDLTHNPFSCTCDLLWFRNWVDDVLKNKSVKVTNFKSKMFRCRTPKDLLDLPVHDFHPTAESCAVKINPVILAAVLGSCLLVALVTGMVLVYRYRWHLRYFAYRLRRRRQYQQVLGTPMNGNEVQRCPFDAYLAHSSSDIDWIFAELLPLVEGEHGLKMFLEERDGVAGTIIVDNITKYMDESARVMLLISDNYNREGWRQCEFEHILYAAFEQDKDIIVILLGDVEAGRMTKDMRRMLTRGTFLQWGPAEEVKRVFRNGLKIALKTQDVGFQSICRN